MSAVVRPFVGREGELDQFRRAVTGGARLTVVEGEAGIGKTRMLSEAAAGLGGEVVVLRGGTDRHAGRALGSLADALDHHVAAWSVLPDPLRRHRDVVAALFGRGPDAALQRDIKPDELFGGVIATLSHVLKQRRGVLMLEDLHWGEPDVFLAIGRILRSEVRCSVVVTMRNDDEVDDAFVELLADTARRVTVERIPLGPLGVADVQRLLRATIGMAATAFANDVHERTGGHPLLLHQLLDTGELGGEMITGLLPATVGESVRRRLIRLDSTSRTVIHTAAVLGPSSTFDSLASFSQFDEGQLLAALRRLCDERLLVEVGPDRFAFVHALTREVVESALLSRERRALHRRALVVLDPAADPARMLRHAIEAGDAPRILDAARRGAAAALASGRVAMARRMARAGLEVEPDDVSLLLVVADAAWRLRHGSEAVEAGQRAVALLADTDRLQSARLHRLLARLAWEQADSERHQASVDELVRLLDLMPPGDRVELLDALAEVTMLMSRDDALGWADQALAAYNHTGDVPASALVNLGATLTDVPARRAEGRDLLRRAVEMTEMAGDSFMHARALNNLLCEAVYTHAANDVRALLMRFESVTLRAGLGAQFGENVALWRGIFAEREGSLPDALNALHWFGPSAPAGVGCLTVFAASLDVNLGRYLDARARFDMLRTAVGGQLGRSQAAGIDALDAEVAARSATEDPVQLLERLFDPAVTLTRYMLDHLDQMGRAAVAIARASPVAAAKAVEVWTVWTADDPDATSIRQHLVAISAEHAGRFNDAKSAYTASLEGFPRRAATIVADAERGIARSCEALGDRVQARQWATAAVSRLASWPGPDRDESVQLLRNLGGRPPQGGGAQARLSDREREVAVLVSRGLTNPQIGTALHISARTVSVHVRHILDKLGAVKRTEIAAHVVREQLAS